MSWPSLIAVAVALAMDAVAVAIVTGLAPLPLCGRRVFRLAFHFGLFQGLMPVLGWWLGVAVSTYVASVDHWIAFGLLVFVGGKMLRESRSPDHERKAVTDTTRGWSLILLSVATSLDAMAVGLTLALLEMPILVPALVIGVVTATLSALAMAAGRRLGLMWGRRVEALGGVVLILIGLHILGEHLGLLP